MKTLPIVFFALILLASAAVAADSGADLFNRRCAGCHGLNGEKKAPGATVILKGQSAQDIQDKLHGYQTGTYSHAGKAIMAAQAKTLSDDQIKELADHVAGF